MKLANLSIHNFRGIHDARVRLFDYNLLVGPNNAGKSTVIDAIRVFYEKDGFKHKPDRDFPFIPGADQESWVDQNKDEHGEVNQLIQEAKTGLTTAIAPVAGDMEAFLGIPKPKSDHRKPQHLLFLHETGQISADRLNAFCAFVEGCLPQAKHNAGLAAGSGGSGARLQGGASA